jgi:hypothetical protein
MTKIIYEGGAVYNLDASASEDSEGLWVTSSDLQAATGWKLKPEGLCRAQACIPLPASGEWTDAQGRIDLAAFARHEGRASVRDTERGIWAFGAAAHMATQSAQAPDFTFPDIDGKQHSLSDCRGRKVFLYTWGSYCGCSFDPPVWETVYDELKDKNFEMISVALDTAGSAAVQDRIRPQALDQRPEEIRRLRGWSQQRWGAKQAPSHPCLIDEAHELSSTYGMSNVPMAVWIDEEGRMVRPPEPAGVSDHFRSMDPDTFKIPDIHATALVENRDRYVDALKDWVANGAASAYALSPEEVVRRLPARRPEELKAALHVSVGHHLFKSGDIEGAKAQVRIASELCPEKWNYRRQAMVLDPDSVGALNVSPGFWKAMDDLGRDTFYPDIDMPGMTGSKDWLNVPAIDGAPQGTKAAP